MSTCPRTCAHTCQPLYPPQKGLQRGPCAATRLPSCAQNFLPNLTQSLANSRVSLVHLYVPLTFQSIGQKGDSYRLPAARTRLRFARCPCTKTAICAVAVNHPHHINCVNHSSNKCQPALVHALLPVNPSIRRKRASSSAHTRPARPRAQPSTASRLPSGAKNFFTQSLVNSRPSLVRALIPVNPPIRRRRASSATCARPATRGLRQPPVCHVAPKISCPISHILSQSLVISRASRLPVIPFNRCQNASNVNPV